MTLWGESGKNINLLIRGWTNKFRDFCKIYLLRIKQQVSAVEFY